MEGNSNDCGGTLRNPGVCPACRADLQEYLDGTLAKPRSLEIFLHLRECADCRVVHDQLQMVFGLLDGMPAAEPPADFDAAILAAVPYESYRAMAELRRERVPVFLEEHFLPAAVRAPVTRWTGVAVSAAATGGLLFVTAAPELAVVAVAGLLPELLVRLQGVARKILALGRVEG